MQATLYPPDKVFTITQITNVLKDMIEGNFPQITLEGEISNFRPNSTGHLYFVLKDDTSQITAVMFKGKASYLKFTPRDGNLVRVRGQLTVYPARGNYQIVINSMEMAGQGNILLMLEERKKLLAQEGLFAESRKKSLPVFPETIGIVTSPTGAALRDVLQIVRRRNRACSIIIFPAIVQGDGAASTIVNQIKTANAFKMCDVLIVGRGGGSLEDLLPFSEESVVRAIAESEIPVVSAVGHEIDWALSDFAADKRAPTPSAAAELVTPVLDDVKYYLEQKKNEYLNCMRQKIDRLKLMVNEFSPETMELRFRNIEQPLLNRFDNLKDELVDNMSERLKDARSKIERLQLILESSSPKGLLERGYSVVRDAQTGKIIRNAQEAQKGLQLEIIPAKGKILATVDSIEN